MDLIEFLSLVAGAVIALAFAFVAPGFVLYLLAKDWSKGRRMARHCRARWVSGNADPARTLLRPVCHATCDTLLRPVHSGEEEHPERLLRPCDANRLPVRLEEEGEAP